MIPKVFHFVFGLRERPEPLHLLFYLCLESCWEVNRPDEIVFHCHHEPYGPYWELIRDRLTIVPVDPDPFVAAYRYPHRALNRYRYAHHADVVRLDALIERGGIYADIDTIFVNPIPDDLLRHPVVLGREDDVDCHRSGDLRPSLCNAFIAAERGAPFAVAWRERLFEAFDGSWSNHSGFLPFALSQEYPDQVHVEPPRTFYKHGFRPAGVRRLLEELDTDLEGVVSMHLWSHLWWDRNRRDFSDVHAEMLTEDHVRQVDTTWTVVARRFLPTPDRARADAAAAALTGWAGHSNVPAWLQSITNRMRSVRT
jgi:hypothetical protein